MIMRGHVHQGVVVPDDPTELPEGARVRFELLPPTTTDRLPASPIASEWNESKNARRCELIEKEFGAGLTPEEAAELERLQEESGQFRELFGPMAADTVRALEAELRRIQSASGKDSPPQP